MCEKSRRIEAQRGDITAQEVDAVVNAANSTLLGGGGVDGAIHRAGGPAILAACREIGGCAIGDAVITSAGNLPARWVIHTVGPIYRGGDAGEAAALASAYRRSLEVASENGIETIAFPSISTGAYGYPVEEAAEVAIATVTDHLADDAAIRLVRFVLFSDEDLRVYRRELSSVRQSFG